MRITRTNSRLKGPPYNVVHLMRYFGQSSCCGIGFVPCVLRLLNPCFLIKNEGLLKGGSFGSWGLYPEGVAPYLRYGICPYLIQLRYGYETYLIRIAHVPRTDISRTSAYLDVPRRTSTYLDVPRRTSDVPRTDMYGYVRICTDTYGYVRICGLQLYLNSDG